MDNRTKFANIIVVDLCHDLGVQTLFSFFFHLHENGQEESRNKVIFKGTKKNLDKAKELWDE